MSSRFLSTGSGGADLTQLQDGTFNINVAEATINNLSPNMPVKTDETRKKLISAKITNTDLDPTLQQFVTDTNFKTMFINLPISPEGTVFSNSLIADSFKIANGPNPPLFLLSDGTRTSVNDNAFIILDSDPYNTFENISASLGDVFYNTTTSSIFGFQPPFRDEPTERPIPPATYSTFDVATEAEFVDALSAEIPPQNTLQLRLIANITFTSAKIISSDFSLISDTGSRMITYSSATSIINFMGDYQSIDGVYFTNSNTGSSATCLAFTATAAANNYVKNCVFYTNEFAITTVNTQIQITDNYFLFSGTSDSHRYIALYKNTGSTIIARNVFQGNPLFSTAGILISVVAGSSFINGKFVFKNNTTLENFPIQRLCISDASFNVNDNLQFWIHDNNIVTTSGFMIFYGVTPMTGVLRIVAYNNTEVLGGSATGSKGIIACDNISATTLPARTGAPYITTFNNTQPALRTDYTGWTSDNNTAYNNTVISAAGNTPKLFSAVLQDIIGSDITEKVANINLPLEPFGTRFLNDLYADKFVVYNGPSPAGFLMSDGTIMTTSSSNINSNIYMYNNNLTTLPPPASGQIRYNNSVNQNATEVYISHLTRDGIDIDPFLALITQLSILYIQDQDNSGNYIKYNVNSTPVITPNSYVTVSVTFLEGNGTGLTNFPVGMNIFLSIFTNDLEINSRLSNLETATQNLTATSSDSTFSKTLKMGGNRIQTVAAPVDVGDATNKSYVDTQNALFLKRDGTNAMTAALNMGTTNKIINLATPTLITDAANKNYVDTGLGTKLNIDGTNTMTAALNMGTQNITNTGTISGTTLTLTGSAADTMPYFSSTKSLLGATRDFYIQSGGTLIQTAITNATTGSVITLSTSSWTESPICSGQNYSIVGARCPLGAQTTQITGNISIGAVTPATVQTRIRLKDIKLIGNISWNGNSTYQEMRTYFDNMDISGTITFPTLVATASGLAVYFNDCSFSGSNATLFTMPNTALYAVYFTDCQFNAQPIVNNLAVGNSTKLIFTNCSIMNSTSLTNCIYNGLNSTASASQLTAGSVKLGGLSTQYLMGDGSLLTATYPTMVSGTFTATFGTVSNAIFKYTYTTNGTNKVVSLGIPHIRSTITGGPLGYLSSTTAALPAAIRPVVESVSSIRIVVANVFENGQIVLFASGVINFQKISSSWANDATGNGSGCWTAGDYMYITYVV